MIEISYLGRPVVGDGSDRDGVVVVLVLVLVEIHVVRDSSVQELVLWL